MGYGGHVVATASYAWFIWANKNWEWSETLWIEIYVRTMVANHFVEITSSTCTWTIQTKYTRHRGGAVAPLKSYENLTSTFLLFFSLQWNKSWIIIIAAAAAIVVVDINADPIAQTQIIMFKRNAILIHCNGINTFFFIPSILASSAIKYDLFTVIRRVAQ